MTEGQKLYQAYQTAYSEFNQYSTAEWNKLGPLEQKEWERTAKIYLNGQRKKGIKND